MAEDNGELPASRKGGRDQRRHPRRTVFKSALLYPVLNEVGFAVEDVSHEGLSGQCALALGLLQQVHVSFDGESYRSAEVRWVNGTKCGLLMEEPLFLIEGKEPLTEQAGQEQKPRDHRMKVSILGTLITSAPVLPGTVRNMSPEGMMIAVNSPLSEGARLLVKTRDNVVRVGRVQWSSGGMAGIFFEPRHIPS